jgi:hypothetical protein
MSALKIFELSRDRTRTSNRGFGKSLFRPAPPPGHTRCRRIVARIDLADMGGIGTSPLAGVVAVIEIIVAPVVASERRIIAQSRTAALL